MIHKVSGNGIALGVLAAYLGARKQWNMCISEHKLISVTRNSQIPVAQQMIFSYCA